MKGKLSYNCGHLPTPWPYLPQEKHYTVAQSLWVVTGRGCGACVSVTRSRRFSIASIPVCAERGGAAYAGTFSSRRFSIASSSANPTEGPVTVAVGTSVGSPHTAAEPSLPLVSQLSGHRCRHGSPTLYICQQYLRVSGGTLSRCRRRVQFGWPAMNRSRISWVLAFRPISPKALTASVSIATANCYGSSLSYWTVFSNWRR